MPLSCCPAAVQGQAPAVLQWEPDSENEAINPAVANEEAAERTANKVVGSLSVPLTWKPNAKLAFTPLHQA